MPTAEPAAELDADVPSGALRCERCGGGFHCGARDTVPCACTGLRLDDAQRRALAARYQRCLCMACLGAIAGGAPLAPDTTP